VCIQELDATGAVLSENACCREYFPSREDVAESPALVDCAASWDRDRLRNALAQANAGRAVEVEYTSLDGDVARVLSTTVVPVKPAGYAVTPELAAAIAGLQLRPLLAERPDLPLDWLEASSAPEPDLSPASRRLLAEIEQDGRPVTAKAVPGQSFWNIQEITIAPALLAATRGLVAA